MTPAFRNVRNALIAVAALLVTAYVAFSAAIFFNKDSGHSDQRWIEGREQAQPSGQGQQSQAEIEGIYSTLQAQLAKGDFDAMIATASGALKNHDGVAPLHYMRGFAYLQKNMIDQAIDDFSAALKIMPTYADAYRFRGVAYKGKGRLDLALTDADKSCELDPKNPQNFVARAITYVTKGDRERAGHDVDTVLRLDPSNKQGTFLRQQLGTPDAVAAKGVK